MSSIRVWARRGLLVTCVGGGMTLVALNWPHQDRTPRAPGTSVLNYINLGGGLLYYHFGRYVRPLTDPEQAHLQAIRIAQWPRYARLMLGLVPPELQYDNLSCRPFDKHRRGAGRWQKHHNADKKGDSNDGSGVSSLLPASDSTSPPLRSLSFSHPLGLAAGFDKHAESIDGLLDMGFSFVEIGSVTPLPQDGNPKPRVFRLEEDRAIINRYGFNSHGADAVEARLRDRSALEGTLSIGPRTLHPGGGRGVLGVNLGKNKESTDAQRDYEIGIDKLARFADYMVVNVSSPNTPGLRALQQKHELHSLLSAVKSRRDAQFLRLGAPAPPLLVKIAPDLSEHDRQDIADVCMDLRLDGLIISNTTLARPPELRSSNKKEVGGLSGAPLKHVSTALVKDMYQRTKGQLVIIGGASLVQVYSSFALGGPYQMFCIKRDLSRLLKRDGFASVEEAVGVDARGDAGKQAQKQSATTR